MECISSTCQESLSPRVSGLCFAHLVSSTSSSLLCTNRPLPFLLLEATRQQNRIPPRRRRTSVAKNSKLSPVSFLLLPIFVKLAALPWMEITSKSSFTFFYMHFYGAFLRNLWWFFGCFFSSIVEQKLNLSTTVLRYVETEPRRPESDGFCFSCFFLVTSQALTVSLCPEVDLLNTILAYNYTVKCRLINSSRVCRLINSSSSRSQHHSSAACVHRLVQMPGLYAPFRKKYDLHRRVQLR